MDARLALLPPAAAEAVRGVLASRGTLADIDAHARAALAAVDWPDARALVPLPDELTPAQRALAELLADTPHVSTRAYALPATAWCRRRWLGLAPGGVLERAVTHAGRRAPLWRVLRELDRDAARAYFAALPLADRLDAYGDIVFDAYGIDHLALSWGRRDELADHGGAWAPAYADRVLALFEPGAPASERAGWSAIPHELKWPVFLSLVRAHVTIEPRWDVFLPLGGDGDAVRECIAAIPPSRRGAALARELERGTPRHAIPLGLALLADYPSRELARAVLALADESVAELGALPRRYVLAEVRARTADSHDAAVALDAYEAALPALPELRIARSLGARDALAGHHRAQLAAANAAWSRRDAAADDAIEILEIVDGAGTPTLELVTTRDDDAYIFRAGTTDEVGYIVQDDIHVPSLELAEALAIALRDQPRVIAAPSRR